MTFDEIKQLLEIVREHELSEFELERDDFKVRIRRQQGAVQTVTVTAPPGALQAPASVPSASAPVPAPSPAPSPSSPSDQEEIELAVVKSPIVGTFYRSPEPGAPSFAEVGDTVKKNQVLCIIEAMKLMNEITSEYEGELVKVYVENGQPVQYGERLFAIRTAR